MKKDTAKVSSFTTPKFLDTPIPERLEWVFFFEREKQAFLFFSFESLSNSLPPVREREKNAHQKRRKKKLFQDLEKESVSIFFPLSL
jgi:hypothetical protein